MEDEYSKTYSSTVTLQTGDLVWAKITGYPWWPAFITQYQKSPQLLFRVDFIADKTHAYLPASKIVPYALGKQEYQNCRKINKHLRQALLVAQQRYQTLQKRIDPPTELLRSQLQQSQQQIQLKDVNQLPRQQNNDNKSISEQQKQILINMKQSYSEKKQKILEKQHIIQQLLTKYNLLTLPSINRKYKPIIKTYKNKKIKHQSKKSSTYLIIRKIYKILQEKNIDKNNKYQIAISLGKQVQKQNNRYNYLRNLLKWIKVSKIQIQMSTDQVIEKYYDQWWHWGKTESDKEKNSDMTTYQ